jgi:hypothetical protein
MIFYLISKVSVPLDLLQYVKLIPAKLDLLANKPLMQFDVTNYTFTTVENDSALQVKSALILRCVVLMLNIDKLGTGRICS